MSAAVMRVDELKEFVADKKGIPTEDALTKMLQEGVFIVTFNKLDGAERVMTCTKSFTVIPQEHQPKTESTAKPKLGLVTVWDTNAKGWRSFKYDRVTKIEEGTV
tara:strand:+ start:2360 stop:2674 length:315 start_codon:yes stop_codon:yes gene_type:complete